MVENKKKNTPVSEESVAQKKEALVKESLIEEQARIEEELRLEDAEKLEQKKIRERVRKEEEAKREAFYKEEAEREEEFRYKLLKQKREDQQQVEGIFRNHETRGGVLSFFLKLHNDEAPTTYVFEDGSTYKIPLGVARHINNNCSYAVYANPENTQHRKTMATGRKRDILQIKERIKRFTFESMLFQ